MADLLGLFCLAVPFLFGFMAGLKKGLVGVLVGIVMGLILGYVCFYGFRKALRWLLKRWKEKVTSTIEGNLFLLFTIAWILTISILVNHITRWFISLIMA